MIALPPEVTFLTAPQALLAGVGAVDAVVATTGAPGAAVEIDLAGCGVFDSSLLAVLLELARRTRAAGAAYRVLSPPANLRKLAALYGVDELLFAPR